MPQDMRHSSFFFRYFGTIRGILTLTASILFLHFLLLSIFPENACISYSAWTLCTLITTAGSCSAFREIQSRIHKKAWFFITVSGILLVIIHLNRVIRSLGQYKGDTAIFSSVAIFLALASIALSFLFFSESKNSIYRIRRYLNLTAIILVTLVTITFTFHYNSLNSGQHLFSMIVYILNTHSAMFVFIIGIALYWMSIWHKEKKHQLIYLIILATVGLAYVMITFYYMPRYIRGEDVFGTRMDIITSVIFMLPAAAARVECCYNPRDPAPVRERPFSFAYITRVERVIPGLSLLLIIISIMLTADGFHKLYYSHGLLILLIFALLLVSFEWISYRSEDALVSILSASPVAIQVTDIAMKHSYLINDSMFDLYRTSCIPPDNIVTSSTGEDIRLRIADSISRRKKIERMETTFLRADGTVFTAECRIAPSMYYSRGIVLIWMTDTTERKKLEDSLTMERDRAESISNYRGAMLHHLCEKMLSGYILAEYAGNDSIIDFRIREINLQAAEILDSQLSLEGKRYREVFQEPSMTIMGTLHECWKTGNSSRFEVYSRNLQKHLQIVVFKTGDHEMVMLLNDITERKKSEMALRENEERMRRAEKVRDISQMAGGIAHDLNNKLMGISSFLSLIDMKHGGPEISRYTGGIHGIIRESADLIENVLTFARKINVVKTVFSMHSLIDETAGEFLPTVRDRITIRTAFNAERHDVSADRLILKKAIIAVIKNSADAIPSSGIITIMTENRSRMNDSFIKDTVPASDDEYLLISITDTGRGIQKENLPRIFDPFFTTKPVGKGRGLGLSSVFGAVQSHGGFIRVNSAENEGTEFLVYLPCADAE